MPTDGHERVGPLTLLFLENGFWVPEWLAKEGMMKVLALIESADHVCYRYRFSALAWALAQEGLLLEALPIQRGLRRIATLLAGSRAEIVILHVNSCRLGN